jgi:hypothetical protein
MAMLFWFQSPASRPAVAERGSATVTMLLRLVGDGPGPIIATYTIKGQTKVRFEGGQRDQHVVDLSVGPPGDPDGKRLVSDHELKLLLKGEKKPCRVMLEVRILDTEGSDIPVLLAPVLVS